jgi:hypothetical protein
VEDALGFKFPVPSEYDYELLNTIIKHRFLEGPGSSEVQTDDYELFNAKNSQVIISENVRLLPGTSIIMAILLNKPASKVYTDETCPMPRCGSTLTTATPGGGRNWYVYPCYRLSANKAFVANRCTLKVKNATSGLTTQRKSENSIPFCLILI